MNDANDKSYILLINPPFQRIVYKRVRPYIPYGLLYIATYLEKNGYKSKVYNADFQPLSNFKSDEKKLWSEIKTIIEKEKPDIVGIGVMTPQNDYALKIASIVKSFDKDITVVLGGYHATFFAGELIKDENVDFIVRNEGEITTLELVEAIKNNLNFENVKGITYKKENKVLTNPNRDMIKNLDDFPFPNRELLINKELYPLSEFGIIIPCRGCPFCCTFCSSNYYWNYRSRSERNIVDEIEYLKNKYHLLEYWLEGDNFFIDKKDLINFSKELKSRNLRIIWGGMARVDIISDELVKELKSSGLCNISLGIESGSQKILDIVDKKISIKQVENAVKILKKRGIFVNTYWMIGFQEETEETITQTKNFIKKLKPHIARTFIMTPFPGSQEYLKAKKYGRLNSTNWSDFHVRNAYLLKRPYIDNEIIDKEINGFFDELAKKETTNWMIFLLFHPKFMIKKVIQVIYYLKYRH